MNTTVLQGRRYKSLVFDCDGVILNSNKIKTDAFAEVCNRYCPQEVDRFLDYHVKNGGVSRYVKLQFLQELCEQQYVAVPHLSKLLQMYSDIVVEQLQECEAVSSLHIFRDISIDQNWYVVSGSDQGELRKVFEMRELSYMFKEIYGSPETKDYHMNRITSREDPADVLCIGDSLYDFEVAKKYGCDFCFVEEWSEVPITNRSQLFNSCFRASSLDVLLRSLLKI